MQIFVEIRHVYNEYHVTVLTQDTSRYKHTWIATFEHRPKKGSMQ